MSPFFKKDKPEDTSGHEWFIPEDGRKHLEKLFKNLKDEVQLAVFTQPGQNDPYNDYMLKFVQDLALLAAKIKPSFYSLDSDEAKARGVENSPTLLVNPDKYSIRYVGAPLGEEGRAFIETLLMASLGDSNLNPTSRQLLKQLDAPREVKVFVNPG